MKKQIYILDGVEDGDYNDVVENQFYKIEDYGIKGDKGDKGDDGLVINIKETLVDAAYTLDNSDVNYVIPTTNIATVITVDDDSITRIGDVIYIDYQGDGTCEIKQGTATLNINENDTLFLDGKYSRVAIQKMSATNYRVFGQLIPA